MKNLIIFGAGQSAEVAHFYFTLDSPYDVVAFAVDKKFITQDTLFGLPVVPFEDVAANYPPEAHDLFVAVTYTGLNKVRAAKVSEAQAKGYTCPSYVSSRATIWPGLKHGGNCFILEDNTIQPHVTIGENVWLWSGNHIGHHTVIEDHVYIASHAVISGAVTVGANSFIGVNATLRDNIRIGRENVIGAGALILKDTDDFAVFKGVASQPAKITSDKLRGI